MGIIKNKNHLHMKTFTLATALLGASAVQVETGLDAESTSQV